jgi:thiol-disulfide isomerase/thioredoxin
MKLNRKTIKNSNNNSKLNKFLNQSLESVKTFFSSKFNVALFIILLILGASAFFQKDNQQQLDINSELVTIYYFYTPTCPYCSKQSPIIDEIMLERNDIQILKYDASTPEGSAIYTKLFTESGLDSSRRGVPAIFLEHNVLVGLQSKKNIMNAIDDCINQCMNEQYQTEEKQGTETGFTEFELPFLGRVDLTKWSLPVLAIILGLVDGFNPCALWVLIFIITLLLGEKSKKKIWIVVGSFVLASAISYFLFMTAWLNLFLLMGYVKIITIIIGMFAMGVGVLHVKEWFTTKGELVCKVGDEKSHEKTMEKIQKVLSKPVTIGMIISIIGLAFVVNAIEFVCSAAIPAVFTQILALSEISIFYHYMYILLYIFFYMLDHIIIFGMAAFALSSGITQKYAKYCKLIGGTIMFIIGLILLFAPHLLR